LNNREDRSSTNAHTHTANKRARHRFGAPLKNREDLSLINAHTHTTNKRARPRNGAPLNHSENLAEDKRPLCQLSSKRLEDNCRGQKTTLPVVLEALRGQLAEWSLVLYRSQFNQHTHTHTANNHAQAIHTHTHTPRARVHTRAGMRCARARPRNGAWPLQDIRLFIRGLCTGQYYSWELTPLLPPPPVVWCNGIAQYMVFPLSPCFAIQHT